MNLIDRAILEWSYKTKKGYPDLNNENDLKVFESLFGFTLNEGVAEKQAIQKIISKYPGKFDTMSDSSRIANKEKVSKEEFVEVIQNTFGSETDVRVFAPNDGPNKSSKFFLFQFDIEGTEVKIILAGGAGANLGIKYELQVAQDLQNFKEGIEEFSYPDLVKEIIDEFDLTPDNFTIIPEGKENKKRPLKFTESGPIIDFSGKSIADTLTDLTIQKDSTKYYISLKYGGTLTFFNAGVTKIFTSDDMQSGKVSNPDGVALLDMLGIDNELFCRVFNEYGETDFSQYRRTVTEFDQQKLYNLISSGIGSGYYMLKGSKNNYDFFKVDDDYNKEASTPTSGITIMYGGAGGTGKRVDIIFESSKYYFKINIRNKQKGLYPSHIMCDYKAK